MAATKFNRSEIMKRAWNWMKSDNCPFQTVGEALKRAWEYFKSKAVYEAKLEEERKEIEAYEEYRKTLSPEKIKSFGIGCVFAYDKQFM